MWKVVGQSPAPTVRVGYFHSSIQGNDAVVVASELRQLGHGVTCYPLGATDGDIARLAEVLTSCALSPVDTVPGRATQSLCIEDTDGLRSWIFPEPPPVATPLDVLDADVIYADYYPELREYLDANLDHASSQGSLVYLNLSGVSTGEVFATPGCKSTIVQASASEQVEPREAPALAEELRTRCSAEMSVLTLGQRGAAFATRQGRRHSPVNNPNPRLDVLGAGALFSAQMIHCVSRWGVDASDLPEIVITGTADRLAKQEAA